jgi:putative addiction module antidote
MQLKVRRVGNSLGVVLPDEVIARLDVREGDNLTLTEGPNGYRLDANDPEVAKQLEHAEKIMRRYHDTLRKLAK